MSDAAKFWIICGGWLAVAAGIAVSWFAHEIANEKDLSDPDLFMPTIIVALMWPFVLLAAAAFGVVYVCFYFLPVQAAHLLVRGIRWRSRARNRKLAYERLERQEQMTREKQMTGIREFRPGQWREGDHS